MMWIGSLGPCRVAVLCRFLFQGYDPRIRFCLRIAALATTRSGSGMAAAVMTAFYSWRLLFLTFHGEPRADEKTMAHVHESPKVMTIPLIILALGAVFAGYVGYDAFVGDGMKAFWGKAILVLPTIRRLLMRIMCRYGSRSRQLWSGWLALHWLITCNCSN